MLRSTLGQLAQPASSRRTISTRGQSFPRKAVLLERTTIVKEPMVVVSAPEFTMLPSSSHVVDQAFVEYASATRKMEDLERLSAELLTNLQELNSAAEALDAMTAPTFQPEQERRAKRAAAREARKAQDAAAAAVADRDLHLSTYRRKRLESQMRAAATSSSAQAAVAEGPMRAAAHPSTTSTRDEDTSAWSHLRAPLERAALASGPSLLLPVLASSSSTGLQAEPSLRAREANAKRARSMQGRRSPAAAEGIAADVSKAGTRLQASSSDGTSQFMKNAATLDLLSGASEKQLTAIVKDLLFLERVKKDLQGILKRQPTMEEWSKALSMDVRTFAARVSAGQQAKAMMLQANYRLVISVCKRYQNKGIALQDLIAEGMQGLLKGVEKFDADKGFRFSTYAHWWIRQAVTRSLSDQGRTVRLPSHMYDLLIRIKSAKTEMTEQLGREPTMMQLCEKLQLTPERINEVILMAQPTNSLDTPVGDDDGMASMKDLLEDERTTPDAALEEVMLRKDLKNILGELSEREAGVIRLRYGLEGEQEMTLEDIGVHFQLTRERIRQIEAKAVRKLKQKQKELLGILHEYKSSAPEVDVVGRNSQGTHKSK